MSELTGLSVSDARSGLARGDFTSAELTEAHIAAIDAADELNAFISKTPEIARQRARQSDQRRAAGEVGLLEGIPIGVKDLFCTEGVLTTAGSHILDGFTPPYQSTVTANLFAAGAVMTGKTNLDEFAMGSSTENSAFGPTRNPWKTTHSPGGSSGGAAALVAAGVVPLAHGSDGGGSIRIPAAFCGLVGLKVSRERRFVPAGLDRLPLRVVTYGVVTRTVRDTAHFAAALDQRVASRRLPRIPLVRGASERRLRIGFFVTAPSGCSVDSEVAATALAAAQRCARLGHKVEEIVCPYDEQLVDDFLLYWSLLAWGSIVQTRLQRRRRFDIECMEPWTRALSARFQSRRWEVVSALKRLRAARFASERLFESYDVLISPTTTAPAPRLGHLGADAPFEAAFARVRDYLCLTPAQNIIGNTAISLPMGMSHEGLPIGVQLSANRGDESTLLELSYELEGDGALRAPEAPMAYGAGA